MTCVASQRRQVARERAGKVSPQDSEQGPMTRFYREMAGLGDEVEARLGEAIGRERAKKLRKYGKGWGSRLDNEPICAEQE
jgi:hypothetical protein